MNTDKMDTKQPENPPAFPSGKSEKTGYENSHPLHEGMTLRDYFAAKAMQSLVADSDGEFDRLTEIPIYAYDIADFMLAARATNSK